MFFRFALLSATVFVSARAAPAQIEGHIYYIPSGSMEPTLRVNDRIWASPVPYRKADPKRGDIAIMELPLALVNPESGKGMTSYVKRVVGVPGDRVELVNRVLKINGQPQKEPFVLWRNEAIPGLSSKESVFRYDMKVIHGLVFSRSYDDDGRPGSWWRNDVVAPEQDQAFISRTPTEPLPPGKFLVLGDHRSNSNDSHVFGLVDRSRFKAKVTLRLYPQARTF